LETCYADLNVNLLKTLTEKPKKNINPINPVLPFFNKMLQPLKHNFHIKKYKKLMSVQTDIGIKKYYTKHKNIFNIMHTVSEVFLRL